MLWGKSLRGKRALWGEVLRGTREERKVGSREIINFVNQVEKWSERLFSLCGGGHSGWSTFFTKMMQRSEANPEKKIEK